MILKLKYTVVLVRRKRTVENIMNGGMLCSQKVFCCFILLRKWRWFFASVSHRKSSTLCAMILDDYHWSGKSHALPDFIRNGWGASRIMSGSLKHSYPMTYTDDWCHERRYLRVRKGWQNALTTCQQFEYTFPNAYSHLIEALWIANRRLYEGLRLAEWSLV